MEKGVKQGKSSYLLLSMKKDQANKTNVERVYRRHPLAWEPGPNGSSVDPQLVQEWVQHSCISCASMLWSWSRAEAEGSGGGRRWAEKGKVGHTMTAGHTQITCGFPTPRSIPHHHLRNSLSATPTPHIPPLPLLQLPPPS